MFFAAVKRSRAGPRRDQRRRRRSARSWHDVPRHLRQRAAHRGGRRVLARAPRRAGARAARVRRARPRYIVAIIGVETYYGRNIGPLARDRRAHHARFRLSAARRLTSASELEKYLLLDARARASTCSRCAARTPAPSASRSSCRAATRRYAVDFDGDGAVDLRGSPADAIGSVANFLTRARLAARRRGHAAGARQRRGLRGPMPTAASSRSYPLADLKRAGVASTARATTPGDAARR